MQRHGRRHRKETEENEEEKDNITEILIEKHRNGPTGKVDLYFDDDRSSFLSISTEDFDGISPEEETDDSLAGSF